MARKQYGASDSDIVKSSRIRRDIRTPLEIARDFIHSENFETTVMVSCCAGLVVPLLNYFNLAVLTPLIIYKYWKPVLLPMYVPKGWGIPKDAHEVNLADVHKRAGPPKAIHYFGFDPISKKQVWSTDNVIRQHQFYAGTTGSGKTESIMGICANFLIFGSGFILIDGKADLNLPAKLFALFFRFLRVNNLFLINYIRGGLTLWSPDERLLSNRFNQFSDASESSISELMKSLLDGDNDIWAKRADDYIGGLTRPLAYQRDMGKLDFSIRSYVDFMELERVGKDIVNNPDIPDEIKASTTSFVRTLPGMDIPSFSMIKEGQSLKNNAQVYEQFGYITMQIIPVLNMIKGDYGHIFNCVKGHINMRDVVTSRRSLCTLLPALEKSPATLQSLGRVVITAAKDMMSIGTGNQLEGDVTKLLEARFSNCYSPYGSIFDEAAYYAVQFAFAPIFAQARGLGFASFIALQDINAVKIIDEKIYHEIKTTAANAVTKIGGRIEDTQDTLEVFTKRGGQVNVASMKSLDIDYDPIISRRVENATSIEKEDMLTLHDFTSMVEGEVIILHRDTRVYCDMFSLLDKIKNESVLPGLRGLTLNDFVPLGRLSDKELEDLRDAPKKLTSEIRRVINGAAKQADIDFASPDFDELAKKITTHANGEVRPFASSMISALMGTSDYRQKMLATFKMLSGDTSEDTAPQSVTNDALDQKQATVINNLYSDDSKLNITDNDFSDDAQEQNIADESSDNFIAVTHDKIIERQQKFDNQWPKVLESAGLTQQSVETNMGAIQRHYHPEMSVEESEKIAKRTYDAVISSNNYPGSEASLKRDDELTAHLFKSILDEMNSES